MKRAVKNFIAAALLVFLLAPTAQAAETGNINFGASVTAGEETIQVVLAGENDEAFASLNQEGWQFSFTVPCGFDTAYAVYDAQLVDSTLDTAKDTVTFSAAYSGEYTIVNATPPTVTSNGSGITITVSENNAQYLKRFTVDCDFGAAEVTLVGTKIAATLNGGKLTILLDGAGEYQIKEVQAPPAGTEPPAAGSSGGSAGTSGASSKTSSKTTAEPLPKDVWEVTEAQFSKAMKAASGGDGVLLSSTDRSKKAVSIPAASLKAAAAKGLKVTVDTPNVSICLDSQALNALVKQAAEDTVVLRYRVLALDDLNAAQRKAVQKALDGGEGRSIALTFSVSTISGGLTIRDLNGGTLRLTVPFSLLPGTETGTHRVYTLRQSGDMDARETQVADGTLMTELNFLSENVVILEKAQAEIPETTEAVQPIQTEQMEPEPAETVAGEPAASTGIPLWLPITAGVCLVLGMGLFLVLWILRKREDP